MPPILIGKRIHVRYDPTGDLNRIFLSCNGKDYGAARPVDIYANAKIKRNHDFSGEIETIDPENTAKGVLI